MRNFHFSFHFFIRVLTHLDDRQAEEVDEEEPRERLRREPAQRLAPVPAQRQPQRQKAHGDLTIRTTYGLRSQNEVSDYHDST